MKHTVIEYMSSLGDGGAETLVKDYALLLDRDQFDVKILVTRPYAETANSRRLAEAGVPVLYIYPRWNLCARLINKFFGRWYRPYRVAKLVREQGATVVHAHLEQLKNLAPVRKKLKNVRLLYTCHSLPEYMFGQPGDAEFEAAKCLLQNNDLQIIALHEQMRQQINGMFGIDTTRIIHNGVQVERFANVAESREEIRRAEGIPEDAFVIGHVGRFSEEKNHEFLLKIACSALEKQPNVYLLMIGKGDLQEQIWHQVQNLGLSDRTCMLSGRGDIPRLMKAMDVFVMPSHYEGLPVTLIEAQAAGLRCVVSDVVDTEAYRTDRVVPMSLKETAQAWVDVILDDTVRGPYSKGMDAYDMSKEIKNLEKLYLN